MKGENSMKLPVRVLLPIDSQSAETVEMAIAYAQEICKSTATKDVLLITHTKDQLRHTALGEHLGAVVVKALIGGRSVPLSTGATLNHGTLATLRYFSGKAVVIAYYADEKLLEFVDCMRTLAGAVVIPWVPGEANLWRERWTPIVHGEEKLEPVAILDDPIIVAALDALLSTVNLSHSMLQYRDREWANETLRILRAKGHVLDPQKIKNWAIRNSWKPGAAGELATLAQRLSGLKARPRLTGIHDPNGRYNRWRSDPQ
jgi:hypothetical protein